MGNLEYVIDSYDKSDKWETAMLAISSDAAANATKKKDPNIQEIGDPSDLNNYLPNSGAAQHMTLHQANLVDVVEGQNLGVEVADGHVIKRTTTGKIKIRMLDDTGKQFEVTLTNVMYVPGLSQRLFSVTKFARHGFHAMIKKNATILYFTNGGIISPVTLQSVGNNKALVADLHSFPIATDTTSTMSSTGRREYHAVPSMRNRDHSTQSKKLISLETLSNHLGRRKCRMLQYLQQVSMTCGLMPA